MGLFVRFCFAPLIFHPLLGFVARRTFALPGTGAAFGWRRPSFWFFGLHLVLASIVFFLLHFIPFVLLLLLLLLMVVVVLAVGCAVHGLLAVLLLVLSIKMVGICLPVLVLLALLLLALLLLLDLGLFGPLLLFFSLLLSEEGLFGALRGFLALLQLLVGFLGPLCFFFLLLLLQLGLLGPLFFLHLLSLLLLLLDAQPLLLLFVLLLLLRIGVRLCDRFVAAFGLLFLFFCGRWEVFILWSFDVLLGVPRLPLLLLALVAFFIEPFTLVLLLLPFCFPVLKDRDGVFFRIHERGVSWHLADLEGGGRVGCKCDLGLRGLRMFRLRLRGDR